MARWNDARFKATHNSYSGNIDGYRGSILQQLDAGVRLLEIDLHRDTGAASGDYLLGHDDPGDQVWLESTNPRTLALSAWLRLIAQWMDGHPQAAPLVLLLDCKDNFSRPESLTRGNFAALNELLLRILGSRLLLPAALPNPWPDVDAVRGRVLAVISGDTTRGYRYDGGARPAVSSNAAGHVVEVHDSGHATRWYWSGALQADGTVRWVRHGKYGDGVDPAIALRDDGWLVEVHKSGVHDTLWSHVGRVRPDFEIEWSPSDKYDNGAHPTLRFQPDGSVREIHKSEAHEQNWEWTGRLDTTARTVDWGEHGKTSDPRFDKAATVGGTRAIRVATGSDEGSPDETLLYSTGPGQRRIRYRQLALVDRQSRDPAWLGGGRFASIGRDGDASFLAEQIAAGCLSRVWQFDPRESATPAPHYPATDDPYAAAYLEYCARVGAIE